MEDLESGFSHLDLRLGRRWFTVDSYFRMPSGDQRIFSFVMLALVAVMRSQELGGVLLAGT